VASSLSRTSYGSRNARFDKEIDLPMKDSGSSRDTSSAPLGARNDDSSLFSLESLKKTEDEAKKQRNREDSGLIDLKALALLEREPAAKGEVTVAAVVAPADLFSVGAPVAPMTAPPISAQPPPLAKLDDLEAPKKSRAPLVIAIGGILAVAAAAAVFATTRDTGASAAAATAAAATPPAVTATATQAPAPAPAADDAPKAVAVNPGERPAPAPSATPTAVAVAPKPVAAAGPAPKAAPKAAAPKEDAPPAAKPADACDLACQMQRAVSGKK
jgi:hypothetical protein